MENQGGIANSQGKVLESTVIITLQSKGFTVVPYSQWKNTPERFGDELLLTNVPYETIYGHPGKTEFKILSHRFGEYRIECKWQQSPGSVDEKFPYLYLNCLHRMPEQNIIIIVDGGGAKPGAVRWLREAAGQNAFSTKDNPKRIQIFNLTEFIVWANQTFRF